jgi:hypothetical protein
MNTFSNTTHMNCLVIYVTTIWAAFYISLETPRQGCMLMFAGTTQFTPINTIFSTFLNVIFPNAADN